MTTLQVKISETDFQRYHFDKKEMRFIDLVEKITRENTRKALLACVEIAKKNELSEITMDEINAEIKVVRDAKHNS